ncbi:MAG: anhydro-N-acetylmuramic acid kinase [Saprospiraceae bacterium]|nr:anhydro-N-acetylmuramic acid kinase [Saprospiraceae bacterium]
MNHNLQRLYNLAGRPSRRIIGLMSGTSMDGLDVALCQITGHGGATKIELLNFETVDYTEDIKTEIRKIFAKKTIDFQHLVLLNEWIGSLHGAMVVSCLQKWGISTEGVDLVASHGQTVFHAPKILHGIEKFGNATLQIGDGDHVAVTTGIITLSDFRQRHIATGGEGAPLAVYGDYFIFSDPAENRIMLNMGGIANFTYLPASLDAAEVFVTDTGTGNTLIDAFTRRFFPEKAYDKDAEIAQQGTVLMDLLATLKSNDFFTKSFPKTTGPELFSVDYVETAVKNTSREGGTGSSVSKLFLALKSKKRRPNDQQIADLLATLTRFSAETIAEAMRHVFIEKKLSDAHIRQFKIYMSGGGMHNPLLVKWLKELLPEIEFRKTNDLGINGDAKEAVLFAILANECVAGNETNFGNRQGVPSVSMGKISFPN